MMNNCYDFKAADKLSFRGKLGAVYSPEKTIFRVWQPFADKAELRLYGTDNELSEALPMKRKNGIFECVRRGDLDGFFYTFFVTRNGESVESADPYAYGVSPGGERSRVINMKKNAPENWENERCIACQTPENAVICELSVRDFSMDERADFTSRGKFSAFCEKNVRNSYGDIVGLEYIKNLGVTHIQLMPIFDFDFLGTEYNWGYNPRFFNSPSGYYSHSNAVLELRKLVSAAHKNELGVIADVVYNHVFDADRSVFGKIFPRYYFRSDNKTGGYSNGSGCGNEFASERKMAGKFILDSLEFLTREYKFDGFRFDLMGLMDVGILRKIERRLRKINPDILLYGEGWTGGSSPYPERFRGVLNNAGRLKGYAFFNDSFRDAVKGSVFDPGDCGYVSGSADEYHFEPIRAALSGKFSDGFWTQNARQTINYVECHDNLTLFDKLQASLGSADIGRIKSADKMAAALVFLSRGIPFIAAGQEFLRSKNGEENSYRSSDSVNCLKWDKVSENRDIVEYYRGLIALRKRFYADFGECGFIPEGGGFLMKTGDLLLIVNPSDKKIFPKISGKFEIFADGSRASDKPLYARKRLCCAEFSIIFARRIL